MVIRMKQKAIVQKTRKVKMRKDLIREERWAYLFIAPIFIGLILFHLFPFIFAIAKSFYNYDGVYLNRFVGFENYIRLMQDMKFWKSMVTLLYYFVGTTLCMAVQVVAARLVCGLKPAWWQNTTRTIFVAPFVVPSVVTVFMWRFIYYPEIGVFARIAEFFGKTAPDFLGNSLLVNPAIIFAGFPWIAGVNFLIFYSAFNGVDPSMREAAEIDGASSIKCFFKVELPMIMPQIKTMYMFALIGLMQSYEKNLLFTNGGPNDASLVPGLYMYQTGFGSDSSFGYSSAISVVLFIITFAATWFVNKAKED